MSERTSDALSDANELLGQFVDLSVKVRVKKMASFNRGSSSEAYCIFCGDTAQIPPEVRHKQGCLVARAKEFLR
jgi:hypothetical protein